MADRHEFVRNMKLRTKLSKILIIKLSAIDNDDGVWQTESVDDEFLNEIFYLAFSDLH